VYQCMAAPLFAMARSCSCLAQIGSAGLASSVKAPINQVIPWH
jgi:hypothetical protein